MSSYAVLEGLLDLVLPQECAGCRARGSRWCAACADELRAAAAHPLGLTSPDPVPAGFPARASAAAVYDGPVRGALLAHKERGRLGLARPLGAALAAAVAALDPPSPLLLVPVPSDPREVRRRGHDHARRLARSAAAALRHGGVDARVLALLEHGRVVSDQSGLDAAGRSANLRGALRARCSTTGLQAVVVDDVVTTGATLTEACRAVAGSGARVIGAASVAATSRRRTRIT